jgi:ribonuclease-3
MATRPDIDAIAQWAHTTLGHDFADPMLVVRALTHSSSGAPNYQRLEFLGDRVLGCVVAAWLYDEFAEAEGKLTARLHALVEGPANARVARALGLPERIIMEGKAKAQGLANTDNVLGDVAEALVAALYLDGGHPVAERFVRREWGKLLDNLLDTGSGFLADPKSRLQEWALKRRRGMPLYVVIDRQGPDHAPIFTIEAAVRGEPPASGTGHNKQEAEKAAALALLTRLEPQ